MEPKPTDWVGPCLQPGCRTLEDLSPEILFLIFEELYQTEGSDAFKPIRSVSRRLAAATVPFFYRDINFKPASLSNPSSYIDSSFRAHIAVSFENVSRYARNARIDCKLDWESTAACLLKCHQLQRLDWAYWDDDNPIPPPIQEFVRTKFPPIRLHIWRCRTSRHKTATQLLSLQQFPHIASIPSSNVVSFSYYQPLMRGNDAILADLLTSSPSLESLELLCVRSKLEYRGKRMNALKHLSMLRCNWAYTASEVRQLWDFSRLETLSIKRGKGVQFLKSVPSNELPRLKKLAIDQSRIPGQGAFTEVINKFLRATSQLEELDITGHLCSLSIEAIGRNASLRVLSLKDHRWTSPPVPAGTVFLGDLPLLQTACEHLAELALDIQDTFIFPTLITISKFRNLREVTIRVPTRLLRRGENDKSLDIDYHSAHQMAIYLSSRKEGMPIEKLSVDVGCYGSPSGPYDDYWRGQKAKGHNPERFFICTWNETGEMCFQEITRRQESEETISNLGLAKWLKVHKFPPN